MESITFNAVIQLASCLTILLLAAKPLGDYMARVYSGEIFWLSRVLKPIENGFYSLSGINPTQEMNWREYASAVVAFSIGGFFLLFTILLVQEHLPLNPQGFAGLDWDLALGTTISFVTNTNWQAYGGESTMSYFSQMVGLTVQNFLSAAMGMAVLAALIRGIARRESKTIGNFWADLVRGNLYILLPLSLLLALALSSQGVIQNFDGYKEVATVEGAAQTLAMGPAASQVAIKQLGTNGGGFFNVNSAHPFENPNALSNLLQWLAILLIPAALCHTFGRMVGDTRQGWTLLIAMTAIFIPMTLFALSQEQGNMEGKEARFGVTGSVLWETATTAASNGSVNSMHDSYTPLGGMVGMVMMQLGEVVYGGVGSGLYGMLVFAILAVFIAGLMVGRTPEYLGKKIQADEIKMASVAIILPCAMVLLGTAAAVLTKTGLAGLQEGGAHGFSEILYAFTSAGMNNGSAFAGLSADSYFYNTMQGIAMLVGRYGVMIPVLAIAGSLAAKKAVPVSAGTLPTHTPLFITLLISVVLMVGLLTFVPALMLGPVVEHLIIR